MKLAEQEALAHRGLAVACAQRFAGRGVPMEELISEAQAALCQAAARFDESRGVRFSTYALPLALGALRDLCRRSAPMHVPRSDLRVLSAADAARERLTRDQGREPGLCQVAREIGVEPMRLGEMVAAHERMRCAAVDLSGQEPAEAGFEDLVLLRDALSRLPPPLPRVVRLRFALGLSQQQTARLLGVSQSCVSRWEKQARQAVRELAQ